MTRTLACLLCAAALVAANPFVETFLSEVGVDPAHQFVELHFAPQSLDTDLTNWQIVTSISVCTLACYLQYDSFLVVDSAALHGGEVGYGTLHLNPLGDSVVVINSSGWVADIVHFPRSPTGYDSAPLPPANGGISFWNFDDFEGQSLNWYVDSTPTPGEANDNSSVIAGSLTGSGGVVFDEAGVVASGKNGRCHRGLYHSSSYGIAGLGAGTYQISAGGVYQGHGYSFVCPDSVTVGYNQTVTGIDIVIPLTGVAEQQPGKQAHISLRAIGRTLTIASDRPGSAELIVRDNLGRARLRTEVNLHSGSNEVPLHLLSSGVYFASCRFSERTSTAKLVLH